VLREVLTATKEEKVPNVKMEINTCLALVHKSLDPVFLKKDVRDRLEKYTIDPEFDTSYFAKKAMKEIFHEQYPIFEEFEAEQQQRSMRGVMEGMEQEPDN